MNKTMTRIADAVREHKHMYTPLYSVMILPNGDIDVWYRGTAVARVCGPDVRLNSGGWRTVTTKAVMNAALFGAEAHAYVYQKHFDWYVSSPNDPDRVFTDGMEVER